MQGSLFRSLVLSTLLLHLLAAGSCSSSPKAPATATEPRPAREKLPEAPTFPPEGIDHLEVALTVEIDILGIGKDRFDLEGSIAVHRGGPASAGGRSIHGELIAASFRGQSRLLGEVVVFESPLAGSPCEYTYQGPGEYAGRFDLSGWLWLPEHDLLLASGSPVRVEGVASGIPPIGQKAVATTRDVPLHDLRKRDGKAVGFLNRVSGQIRGVVAVEDPRRKAEVLAGGLAASP